MESFKGRLRDELLNVTLFTSLAHVRDALAIWMDDYNTARRTARSAKYAASCLCQTQRSS